jgi:hypothetical protein
LLLTDREPLPGAFAFSLLLLAMGLLVQKFPLLASVSAGIAFLYDPLLSAPFWGIVFLSFAVDKKMRPQVRPMLPVFLIFALLLANLAQLQPGASADPLFAKVSEHLSAFQRTYVPQLYVSSWPAGDLFQILAMIVLAVWAAARCWPLLSNSFRWVVLGGGLCGFVSIPISYLAVDEGHLAWAARLQPTRTLLFSLAAAALLFGLAGMRAMLRRSFGEAFAWFLLLFALLLSQGIFDLLRLNRPNRVAPFALAFALAALFTWLLLQFAAGPVRFVALAVPVLAALSMAYTPSLRPDPIPWPSSIAQLASWADTSTWGSSIFLFPDAGHSAYPSVFRAESRHGLWVDWNSARGVAFSEAAADRWQQRWNTTMNGGFSTIALQGMLPLPIDYYVLRMKNRLQGPRHVFADSEFVVYDAEDLRNAPKPLQMQAAH